MTVFTPVSGGSAASAFSRTGIGFPHVNFDADGGAGGGAPPVPPVVTPTVRNNGFSSEYVHDLREENKSWRLKLAEEQAARKADGEAKTAAEKAAAEAKTASEAAIAEATKKANSAADSRVIAAELRAIATKAGMVDLDGLKLADLSGVTLDDKGDVQGADALMEALKIAKPYLFGTIKTGTSTTDPVPPKVPPAAKKVSEMTPEEYAAARKLAVKGQF